MPAPLPYTRQIQLPKGVHAPTALRSKMPKQPGKPTIFNASGILIYTTKEHRFLDVPTSIMPQPPSTTGNPPAAISQAIDHDNDRYSRQILFPGIGATGQHLLASAHVAIVGVGATGAAAASLLARAGVGTLTLIDRDFVEPSNLQRQILFDEADARESLPKAEAARRKIALFNPTIKVHAQIADLTPGNIHELLAGADIILDATDNFETRYLLNDYAVQQSKPWIYAAAIGAYAATMTILPKPDPAASPSTPYSLLPTSCLACIFPKPPS